MTALTRASTDAPEPSTERNPDTGNESSVATDPVGVDQLWHGDTGTLRESSRRALAALVKGPYVSAERHRDVWRALLADTAAIRSRLADLFLDLVIDDAMGVAFIRGAQLEEGTAPQVVRTLPLTFLDTVLLLHLRGELVRASGGGRVIVGKDEVVEQLQVYRAASSTDEAGFAKRINASWAKLEKQNLLAKTSTEGRFEISPVLRLVFGPEEIASVSAEYERLIGDGGAEFSLADDGGAEFSLADDGGAGVDSDGEAGVGSDGEGRDR